MQKLFSQHYPLSEQQYDSIWTEGLIVIESNALLDIYRFAEKAREEFLQALAFFKPRLWIPHQVAMEFQINRPATISDERDNIAKALEEIPSDFRTAINKLKNLHIEKRNAGIDNTRLEKKLESALSDVQSALEKIAKKFETEFADDPVRSAVDDLIGEKIGDPFSQEILNSIFKEGEERYRIGRPPGYMDVVKSKEPRAEYVAAGLTHKRAFGDLVLWKQLLKYVKDNNEKAVLLISSEQKEDWISIERGKKQGPAHALREEMRSIGGTELFWIYSPDQFLKHSEKYSKKAVSAESVQNVQETQGSKTLNSAPSLLAERGSLLGSNARIRSANAIFERMWMDNPDIVLEKTFDIADYLVHLDSVTSAYKIEAEDGNPVAVSIDVVEAISNGAMALEKGLVSDYFVRIVFPSTVSQPQKSYREEIKAYLTVYHINAVSAGRIRNGRWSRFWTERRDDANTI